MYTGIVPKCVKSYLLHIIYAFEMTLYSTDSSNSIYLRYTYSQKEVMSGISNVFLIVN